MDDRATASPADAEAPPEPVRADPIAGEFVTETFEYDGGTLQVTRLTGENYVTAMCRALAALPLTPHYTLVDGRDLPKGWTGPAEAIIKGDASCATLDGSFELLGIGAEVLPARCREGRC